jgi:hypothetical protein
LPLSRPRQMGGPARATSPMTTSSEAAHCHKAVTWS